MLKEQVVKLLKYSCFLLALFVIGWGFTEHKAFFLGLILGTCAGLFNALFMAYKVYQFGVRQAQGRPMFGTGMLTRYAVAIVATFFAVRYPDRFNVVTTVIGLALAQLILFVNGLWDSVRTSRTPTVRKGGE